MNRGKGEKEEHTCQLVRNARKSYGFHPFRLLTGVHLKSYGL